MTETIAGAARVRDLLGVEVLDMNTAPYSLMSFSEDEEIAERTAVSSPWVDGDVVTGWRLLSTSIEMTLIIEAATWPEVEGAFADLKTALKATPTWLLERELAGVSVIWRAERPTSITSPIDGVDVMELSRIVTVRIPVQPTPAITGLDA